MTAILIMTKGFQTMRGGPIAAFCPIVLAAMLLGTAVREWACAPPRLPPDQVPTLELRAHVLSIEGKKPGSRQFTFQLNATGRPVAARGDGWSGWLTFDRPQVEARLREYPAIYLPSFPVVLILRVDGMADPTLLEAEIRFRENGQRLLLRGELFGPSLGILIWRDESHKPQAATMAGYNRRYWKELEGAQIPKAERPKRFPIVDRFIGGDDDRRDWREGIEQLARAGMSVVMLPPSRPIRPLLLQAGLRRTAWAVYSPPGYAFDFGDPRTPAVTAEAVDAWAVQQAQAYLAAGYARGDMGLFAMSDEPGWYYPQMFRSLTAHPVALDRFRDYLKAQRLNPADVGAASWHEVQPKGRTEARDLPARRLFYWTARFFTWDSARHFARCTQALEKAFRPNVPLLTNWNFFSGRFYVPGPVANNPDKATPDAAMGGHDWFEFGKLRGSTMLWTEDWFPDSLAYQWSYYAAKLRSAASKSGVPFGGYIVPRAAGDREDGLLQKVLCLVGSGGKAVQYYVFGPEYNFPGNCYSERTRLLPKIAEANRMIGRAEDLLWAGRRPRAQVALLAPRSAQVWDAREIALPTQIQDATNTNLNAATVDYMAEVADLYLALQHQNIPVDFVSEDDLTPQGLKPYRVLYVTEPNVPEEGQRGIAAWTRAGGTLVTVTGAGERGRYDEPCGLLTDATGMREQPRMRLLVPSLDRLPVAGWGRGALGEFTAAGARGTCISPQGRVEATFDDGSPAVVRRALGKGRVVHFAWMPGLSYASSSRGVRDRLPVDFSPAIRRWIVHPTQLAGVRPPVTVDRAMVETPVLASSGGEVVTLLNWTGEPGVRVNLRARVSFAARRVTSLRHGPLPFRQVREDVTFSLPLNAADIVTLRP
jgi:hypothetical protein